MNKNTSRKKCIHCSQLILRKVSKFDGKMSDIKAKMHQIRFPLGLRHRPRWGSLQRSPTPSPLAVFKGAYLRGGYSSRRGGKGE